MAFVSVKHPGCWLPNIQLSAMFTIVSVFIKKLLFRLPDARWHTDNDSLGTVHCLILRVKELATVHFGLHGHYNDCP